MGEASRLSSFFPRRPAWPITYEDVLRVVRRGAAHFATMCSTVQCSAHKGAVTPPQVGDPYAHPWQLKIVLLFWIQMYMCGTQFITTSAKLVLDSRNKYCPLPGRLPWLIRKTRGCGTFLALSQPLLARAGSDFRGTSEPSRAGSDVEQFFEPSRAGPARTSRLEPARASSGSVHSAQSV
jgi:hypothetical protein